MGTMCTISMGSKGVAWLAARATRVVGLGVVGGLSLLGASHCRAAEFVIYVAPKDSAAAGVATGKANGTSSFAERTLQRALEKAGELLGSKGEHTASVLIAGGEYAGKAGAGTLVVPRIDNAQGTLRILGGWDEGFATRQPFKYFSRLATNEGRNQAMLLLSRQSKLKELVISGLVLDAAASNKYDEETNSLLKGASRTVPLINLAILQTDRLVIADNTFLNGAHGAFDPYIAPASASTTVEITNNFFLNTVKAIQIGAGIGFRNNTVREVNFRNNTVLMNWPFNPDATSSNVSAVTLYHNHGAQQLNIEGNLFAHNVGGAMQHDWPENRMPRIALRNNLFWKNASLFGNEAAAAGVFVGKFGTNAKYLVLDVGAIEDDFSYTVGGNVAIDPGLAIKPQLKVAPKEGGDDVGLSGYAPAMKLDAAILPLPINETAKSYGVQTGKAWAP